MRTLEVYRSIAFRTMAAALIAAPAAAQDNLSTLIPNLMRLAAAPGLSIAVVENGAVRWAGSFGVKSVKRGESVDGRTVFPAASLSKAVFVYAVLQLADRGELDLDAPLSAIAYYRRSLELNPRNTNAAEAIKKIEGK